MVAGIFAQEVSLRHAALARVMVMSEMTTSTADVSTDRPARYGKQLASHFGHKIPFTWDADTRSGSGRFADGAVQVELSCTEHGLHLRVQAAPEDVERFEGVVGRHLVRFGSKDELVCTWTRADGSQGTTQRHDGD